MLIKAVELPELQKPHQRRAVVKNPRMLIKAVELPELQNHSKVERL
jgi:hypothetical protein